ncbi:OmpA family protein [Lishizhenia tianjinensis]|uniref:OmpA family protein n=1 Tax=Lishizhenia tianjinensis TaxID=477690 RepID=A0A1I6YNB8_9FLAO|nr:OmpA family protein [Lishizhenia tianjinensis]SFT51957.1 OmpA family protein [Lishizhenia tianjinensis]
MRLIFLFTLLLLGFPSLSSEWNGQWKGILSIHQDFSDEQAIYLNLEEGQELTRIELTDTDVYALKRFKINDSDAFNLEIEEINFKSRANSRETPRCKLKYNLKYNDSTGYLEGTFTSVDCKNYSGYVILYKADYTFPTEKKSDLSHLWVHRLKLDLDKGFSAPAIRKKELESFKFKPIYFDHDKSVVKAEFHAYLKDMIRVVQGHSDIRIKVTGHTDAVGTDAYNVGLSERRAKAIKDFFVANGLPEDKLEIDFKGEREPVDTNSTREGKQHNRRVDFSFV